MNYDSRSPLYMQVHNFIENRILQGELQPHDRIPTEKQLMDQFQVSRITVVNALAALVKEGVIYRVPGRGSFVAERNAKAVTPDETSDKQPIAVITEVEQPAARIQAEAKLTTRTVGLIIPSLNDYFEIRIINAIKSTLKERGISLLLAFSGGSKEQEEERICEFISIGVEGLLLFPVDEDVYNEEILSLKVKQFPFVLIDRYLPGVETHYVCSDNRLGAKLAVEHLMELGHHKIAICTDAYRDTMSVQDRIHGYMDAYQQSGKMINPALILTDFTVPEHPEAMMKSELARYMKSGMATAYLSLNGNLGNRIQQIATQLGYRIPEDISIVNFDDPGSPNGHEGFFTHIDQDEAQIGRLAAIMLADLLEERTADHHTVAARDLRYRKIMLPPKLHIRQSSSQVAEQNVDTEVRV